MDEHDREAVARLKRGDIGGLEPLVRRYHAPALKAAFLICRDAALAEDLVQAAFLRAYERIDQFDASRPFGPWFLRSVVNDALTAARRRRHSPLDEGAAADLARIVGVEPDPAETLVAAETREAIGAALERLSPEGRAAPRPARR